MSADKPLSTLEQEALRLAGLPRPERAPAIAKVLREGVPLPQSDREARLVEALRRVLKHRDLGISVVRRELESALAAYEGSAK